MIYFKSLYISYFQSLMNLFNYDNCLKEILRIEYLRGEGNIFCLNYKKLYVILLLKELDVLFFRYFFI